jgi:hypothetical protein
MSTPVFIRWPNIEVYRKAKADAALKNITVAKWLEQAVLLKLEQE